VAKTKKFPRIRDYLIVALIKGATKSAIHTDRKKQANKRAARRRVRPDEEE
jgi:hypothetical protein